MTERSLYNDVKRNICRMIYNDTYKDGDTIPPERRLSEELGVSRVTVRKALKLLEEEHVIERVQGRGTRVALEYGARQGDLDIITLVAPAKNAFFSRFLDAFERVAEEKDSLVLFKQKSERQSLEECLFRIYEKNIRNVVLWLEDMDLSDDAFRKLRGLGMNMVLFDSVKKNSYADAVCLDNAAAIQKLVSYLQNKNCKNIAWVGWNDAEVASVRQREEEFVRLCPKGALLRIPWEYHNHLDRLDLKTTEEYLEKIRGCDGVLYSVGELAVPFEQAAARKGISRPLAMIDETPGFFGQEVFVIDQDMPRMADRIFGCLEKQNQKGSAWKAKMYKIDGVDVYNR